MLPQHMAWLRQGSCQVEDAVPSGQGTLRTDAINWELYPAWHSVALSENEHLPGAFAA